jgi:hypothetical protein
MVIEYEPEAKFYPEGSTIEQMAEIDMQTEDKELLFGDCVSDTITYEIIGD